MIDVCFLLEGSYPYVAGGVSTWVHELINSMQDLKFGIVFIAPNSDPTRTLKYALSKNVLYLKEIYLHDYALESYRARKPTRADYEILHAFYDGIFQKKYDLFPQFLSLFRKETGCFDVQGFFSSPEIWEMVKTLYGRYGDRISFLDFFWTWRGTHLPLLQVLSAALPRARIYHSISTGYAGLLGAMAKVGFGEKFFLTEHGIYTHERLLEISQANWIYERESKHFRAERELSLLKRWWIGLFQVMSDLTYAHADKIFTLFEGNRMKEIFAGAHPDKIAIIPNGIAVKTYSEIQREKKEDPQIGFIGRVVSIKDVKNFILAAKMVVETFPKAKFYIIGPTDEEEDYFEECVRLVDGLRMESSIQFVGRTNVLDYYKFLDLVVLTSVSEAQPYAILEANAASIPVVATDVGACRELLEGKDVMDRALGKSGIITDVGNPRATAAAIIELLKNKALYAHMSEAGRKRMKKYYDVDDLRSRYLNIYEQNL